MNFLPLDIVFPTNLPHHLQLQNPIQAPLRVMNLVNMMGIVERENNVSLGFLLLWDNLGGLRGLGLLAEVEDATPNLQSNGQAKNNSKLIIYYL